MRVNARRGRKDWGRAGQETDQEEPTELGSGELGAVPDEQSNKAPTDQSLRHLGFGNRPSGASQAAEAPPRSAATWSR